jgi:hypothetical protein
VNFNYRLQEWVRATLGYSFESFQRDTPGNIGFDYDVNRVTLGIVVGY